MFIVGIDISGPSVSRPHRLGMLQWGRRKVEIRLLSSRIAGNLHPNKLLWFG